MTDPASADGPSSVPQFTVHQSAYVLLDSEGRTWLAFGPANDGGIGVMQPLRPGDTVTPIAYAADTARFTVTGPQGGGAVTAYLVPEGMRPAGFAPVPSPQREHLLPGQDSGIGVMQPLPPTH